MVITYRNIFTLIGGMMIIIGALMFYSIVEDIMINNKITSIEKIAQNITSDIKTFYNFNLTNVGKEISFDELKRNGGVCWHYALYAISQGKKMGTYGEVYILQFSKTETHAVAIISNEEGYCIIDQRDYKCFSFV